MKFEKSYCNSVSTDVSTDLHYLSQMLKLSLTAVHVRQNVGTVEFRRGSFRLDGFGAHCEMNPLGNNCKQFFLGNGLFTVGNCTINSLSKGHTTNVRRILLVSWLVFHDIY